jgi:hypothetical protein
MASRAEADRTPDEVTLLHALELIADACPWLTATCYWAGTSCISIEELHHRRSFDLDFHTTRALQDVRPVATELTRSLGRRFQLTTAPDEHGSGFRGLIQLPSGEHLTIEVLSNYQDVPARDLVTSATVPAIRRITLRRYVVDKVQCLLERAEARDLVDLDAALEQRPELVATVREAMRTHDALLLVERLQSWSDEGIAMDLKAYDDVDPARASGMRDRLLGWIREREEA